VTREVHLPGTHALYRYEFDSPRLSSVAREAFDSAEQHFGKYIDFVRRSPIYHLDSITWEDLGQLPQWTEIPEMHDRLIAIAARRLNAAVLNRPPWQNSWVDFSHGAISHFPETSCGGRGGNLLDGEKPSTGSSSLFAPNREEESVLATSFHP